MKIEDIILSENKNGVFKLKKYLDNNFCEKATRYILKNLGKIMIITGFYVDGTCETDGIPGAIALAEVLNDVGSDIIFVTDGPTCNILKKIQSFPVICIHINQTEERIKQIITKINPTLLIFIERCGRSKNGRYYNFKNKDITEYTAKLDILAKKFPNSVSIGDWVNEVGFGNLYEFIKENISSNPSIIRTKHLVVSTTSNWGCYGVIAYISKLTRKNYINKINDGQILSELNKLGVVDGITKKLEPTVDGYNVYDTKKIIEKLKKCTF